MKFDVRRIQGDYSAICSPQCLLFLARLSSPEIAIGEVKRLMTITDDSLSNELERELLASAAAMCLWQEWMVWFQGGRTSAFTDAFGMIGPVAELPMKVEPITVSQPPLRT